MAKTALLTWEMGGGLGHLACLKSIAGIMSNKGFKVHVALKDLSRAHLFFSPGSDVVVHQAPVWLPKLKMQRPIGSLADLLLTKGYLEPAALATLVQSWRTLFDLAKPDLLVSNYSPTAMLASVGCSFPRMVVGTGFSEPVAGQPLQPWRLEPEQKSIAERQEQELFKLVRQAVPETEQLQRYSDIYQCRNTFIYSPPALDAYAETRHNAVYGLLPDDGLLPKVEWPQNRKPNILLYLKTTFAPIEAVLKELERLSANVLLVCPGQQSERLLQMHPRCSVISRLVDMAHSMASADLFIGHGALGTTSQALMMGVPVIALPLQLENELIGKALARHGVGFIPANNTKEPFAALVARTLEDREIKQRCVSFSEQQGEMMENDFSASFGNTLDQL